MQMPWSLQQVTMQQIVLTIDYCFHFDDCRSAFNLAGSYRVYCTEKRQNCHASVDNIRTTDQPFMLQNMCDVITHIELSEKKCNLWFIFEHAKTVIFMYQ